MARSPTGSLWRHRDFLLLWGGETASQVGTRIGQLAAPLLAATALGATPWQMGLLTAAQTAGFLLIGLLAGVVLDRVRRVPVMVAADLIRFALLVTVPLAWWFEVLGFGHLLLVTFLAGLATVFFDIAYQSVLPSLVGREHLVEGNGKLESTRAAAEAGGPALGGALVHLVGGAATIGGQALGYLMSAAAIARIRTVEPAPVPTRPTVRAEIAEGLRFVLGHPLLRPIVLCTAWANLAGGMILAVLVLFLVGDLGLSEVGVGIAVAVIGVGGLAGAATAGAWTRRLGQARTIVVSLLVTTPLALLIPLGGPGPLLLLTAVGLFADGYGGVVYNVAQVSFRQAICPDRLLGRMNASVRFLVWGTLPVGGLLGGALGELLGPRGALLVACCALALSPLPVLLSPLRRLRDLPAG
ncbi:MULTISPECIES: MFS transporter [Pseudonocardia]|uniref:Enterobactin exporter EntS n=2 Tax=Pseudonocardia TaxID=1847 RepID=A0A1Y2MPC6_PSEAH|nr:MULTISPECIES: MFS transporter [Pseudonocardia]OSY36839.1 Enterobactin exporter EntS [Pseudonocardia autotrophica]TDN76830.1 putative MFS family arabinose efflux permease [Pseudonocardia autotrophica]BBG00831.1 MFS transporter [Pseudonocardia autotrophica]GEC28175.1 MFS transporter [Pseudonocardia saturnea]